MDIPYESSAPHAASFVSGGNLLPWQDTINTFHIDSVNHEKEGSRKTPKCIVHYVAIFIKGWALPYGRPQQGLKKPNLLVKTAKTNPSLFLLFLLSLLFPSYRYT